MSFFDREELEGLGFAALGRNVRLSRKASIYNSGAIALGDNVRIDDFCILSPSGDARFTIGDHVHVACHTILIGQADIVLEDFSNLSSRISVYSSSDDFSGDWMTNPTVPAEFTQVRSAPVTIGEHVVIGSGSVVLPGVVVARGCAVGALSLINRSTEPFGIYAGTPARRLKERTQGLLTHEARLRARAELE
jgi:galactoside O-acetyltransferase